ncbi:AAA family ATPase [Candidatus Methanoperedens nitratireducens]|nr:AAA family ATPase [Candidatus Methanoperedens nitroreducens]
MVNATLRKVVIKNFKSLHDCEIDIGKLNVVVGANASGKSNLIEAFRLLKKIYAGKDSFPFLEWWGYDNVVWQRKEELPIIIGLTFDIEGYDVYFETNFTGVGQKFQILREILDVRDYVKIYKEGEWITIKHDKNFIISIIKNLDEYDTDYGSKVNLRKNKNKLTQERKFRTDLDKRLLDGYNTGYINTDVFSIWGGFKLTEKKPQKYLFFLKLGSQEQKKKKCLRKFTFYVLQSPTLKTNIILPKFL